MGPLLWVFWEHWSLGGTKAAERGTVKCCGFDLHLFPSSSSMLWEPWVLHRPQLRKATAQLLTAEQWDCGMYTAQECSVCWEIPTVFQGGHCYWHATDFSQMASSHRRFLIPSNLYQKLTPKKNCKLEATFWLFLFADVPLTYLVINCQICFLLKSTRWHGSPGLPQ